MNVNGTVNLATNLQSGRLGAEIGTAILKKAIDTETRAAQQLIETLPATGGLGQNIDINA